ncbi:nitrate- and nitrite sensing domain-containing protein [Streptosporangium sp. NBC_01639]|uniref:sensor histidine kinase n=1 Tax=Streptosporangium sp. NBC_01639 TaxID=2975948 RepID=UPI00386DD078|nr:nitrate- and nitrite sensing domain-containing protein [Streptosporangium sp. NBC_01639]
MRTSSSREDSGVGPAETPASSDQDTGGASGNHGSHGRRGRKLALRNWRVRSRLIALVLIPTLAGVVLGGLRIVSSVSSAADYGRTGKIAEFALQLSTLTHELALERDLSTRFIAERRAPSRRMAMKKQQAVVNTAADKVRATIDSAELVSMDSTGGQRVREKIAQVRTRLAELASVRQTVASTQLLAQPTLDMYSRAIQDLHAIHDEIGQDVTNDEALTGSVSAFAALTRAKEQVSRERAALAIVIASGQFSGESFDTFVSTRAQRDSELVTFRTEASLAQRQAYDDTVSGPKKDRAELFRIRALVFPTLKLKPGTPSLLPPSQVDRWFDSASDVISRMRDVQESIGDSIVFRTKELQDDEQRNALIVGAVVTALLLLVLGITVLMAQSLVRPLRTLRTEALSIAGRQLPETVQKLRETGEPAELEQISPIGVNSDDEIGQVARAFDEVHREAVRLAGQEATLRSNVNAMFVNLSRRSQTLVERQLSLIESLEQGEQDENRLGSLFRLDHLATRMRRNSENLLVLAGQEPARRWSQPIALIDVVRASLSEVENYERVDLRLSGGVSVAGTSVNDVVHLIAELVENAISFSPRETKVIVSSNRIDGGGVMVSITDIGIGMTPEELAQANWRLANPPVVDVSVSRRMGLFVVGRLALRHGIRVQLRQQDSGGLTAMVLLPDSLLSLAGAPATPAGPAAMPMGDWASSMASMDRSSVLASPTPLDSGHPSFASFEAAHPSLASLDMGQFNSFEAMRPAPGEGGHFGQAPVDTPWPGHTPPPGADPGWPSASQADTGVWPNPPSRGGDSGGWASPPSRGGDSGMWSDQPSRGGDSGMWSSPPSRGGDSGVWSDQPSRDRDSRGRSGGDSGAFQRSPFEAADNTGPLPVVRDSSPMEEAKEEFLPIFAAVESDWFRKVEPAVPDQAVAEEPTAKIAAKAPSPPKPAPAPEAWSSPADAGWQAAKAASEPTLGGITGSGLPKRVPKANLVPGTAAPDLSAAPQTPVLRPTVSPEAVRNRLASFQKGVRQGRAAARGEAGAEQAYPDFGRGVEGNKEDR